MHTNTIRTLKLSGYKAPRWYPFYYSVLPASHLSVIATYKLRRRLSRDFHIDVTILCSNDATLLYDYLPLVEITFYKRFWYKRQKNIDKHWSCNNMPHDQYLHAIPTFSFKELFHVSLSIFRSTSVEHHLDNYKIYIVKTTPCVYWDDIKISSWFYTVITFEAWKES